MGWCSLIWHLLGCSSLLFFIHRGGVCFYTLVRLGSVALSNSMLKAYFISTVIGVSIMFSSQYFIRLMSVPRRQRDYPDIFLKFNLLYRKDNHFKKSCVLFLPLVIGVVVLTQNNFSKTPFFLEWFTGGAPSSHLHIQVSIEVF